MTGPLLLTIPQAATAAGVSADTIRRAIKATDPAEFPPPLPAKLLGKRYGIRAIDLERWVNSLPDG